MSHLVFPRPNGLSTAKWFSRPPTLCDFHVFHGFHVSRTPSLRESHSFHHFHDFHGFHGFTIRENFGAWIFFVKKYVICNFRGFRAFPWPFRAIFVFFRAREGGRARKRHETGTKTTTVCCLWSEEQMRGSKTETIHNFGKRIDGSIRRAFRRAFCSRSKVQPRNIFFWQFCTS
jgi:hypothetical protein